MFLTDHLRDTDTPQTYLQHGRFALTRSVRLIVAGVVGVIHSIFPWWFKFYTSEQIVKTFVEVKASGRHNNLLHKYGLYPYAEYRAGTDWPTGCWKGSGYE